MKAIEATGKTLEEAKENAAKQLGADVSKIKWSVVEESKGLFGKSVVRVRGELAEAPAKVAVETKPEPVVAVAEPVAAAEEPAAAAVEPEPTVAAAPKGRGRSAAPKKEAPTAVVQTEEGGEPQSEVVATQEDADKLLAVVKKIIDSAELTVDMKVSELSGRYVSIELDGRDVAHLVGKHGEVINALQYLVNIISSRKVTPGVRATIDGNNYRRRREEQLSRLANRIATEVKNRQEEAVLNALPAFERRIVHKALSTFEGVVTYSEGEEPNRCVVVAPVE
ncbi:MAG: KH domain-containing protein [Armatimonadetes bacterium]|nr:KH domain-containing protein [Armatimonadota bacterium]